MNVHGTSGIKNSLHTREKRNETFKEWVIREKEREGERDVFIVKSYSKR